MTERDKIIEYCADRFREQNYIAKREDIAMVFRYEDDWYELHGTETNFGCTVTYTDQEDIAKYIHELKPDIPLQTILEVLESHDEYHENSMMNHNEMDKM